MKKYLKDLEEELRKNNLSEEEIEEILADHEEMIETAKKEGLSEDELNAKFGDPKDVAEELSDFSEQADDTKNEDKENKKRKNKQIVFEGVNENYGVSISLVNEDLRIQPTEEDKITVEYVGRIDISKYDIGFKSNEFYLKSPKRLLNNYFNITRQIKFIIHLPKNKKIEDLKIKLVNGDAKLKEIFSSKIEFETTNGDLKLENLNTKEFKLKVINGDVSIETVNCESLKISTISGDFNIKKLKVKKDIFVNTVSGDMKITDSECAEISLKTVSGDIKGNEFYPAKIALSSVSGDIKIINTDETRPIQITKERTVTGDIDIILKQKK
jgi:DUF4097 and DUF4098 domain-containing protein YvlB